MEPRPEVFRRLPFPVDADAFSTDLGAAIQRTVLTGDQPAGEVIHTADGSWLVSDGVSDPNVPGATVVGHLRHVIEYNSSVAELATLPPGHIAGRADPGDPWVIELQTWAPDADA